MEFITNKINEQENCVVESPTGTGKSLVIAAIIKHYLSQNSAKTKRKNTSGLPDWLLAAAEQAKQEETTEQEK